MARLSIVFIVAYVLSTAVVIYIHTAVLRHHDPTFRIAARGGFEYYWPLWMAAYMPLVIASLVAIWLADIRGSESYKVASLMLVVIVIVLGVSCAYDIHWHTLLLEWVVVSAAFFVLARVWSGS